MKQPALQRVLLLFIWACIIGGVLFFATLHLTLPYIMMLRGAPPSPPTADMRYFLTLCCWYLGTTGALALLLILRRMVRSLDEDPFVQRNVLRFRRMGFIALGMVLLALLAAALNGLRPMMLMIGMVILFCALLSLVMSGVFAQAVRYKDENELVI